MNLIGEAKEHLKNFQNDIKSTAKLIIKSSSKWGKLSSVPSVDVDVILTFPSNSDMEFIQWFMKQLVDNVPDLSFSLNYHRNADEYALYLTSSYKSLLRGAEMLNIRKKVSKDFGGGYREFNLEELDIFEDIADEELFLTSQERQSIIMYWLNTLKSSRKMTKYGITMYPWQGIVATLKIKGKISQIFPLHNREILKQLEETWVTKFTNPQPLDEISSYFGVKIALYFAWLGHYTTALLIPTLIGVMGWQLTSQDNMDFYYILTALFNILWATFYLKHWRRTCSELTYKWGTIDYQMLQNCEDRPEFKGKSKVCTMTGQQIRYYPNWKRQLTVYFISLPTIFFCFLCVIKVSLLFSELQVWVDGNIEQKHWWSILSPIPKVMLAFVIGFMDDIYKKIATRLNKWENHQLEETYKNYMMTKLILFQFMNSFFSLFHIAFYLQDLVKLREQLATLLITRQFIGNIKEIVMPFINTRVKQTIMGIKYERRRQLERRTRESSNTEPNEPSSTVRNRRQKSSSINSCNDREQDAEGENKDPSVTRPDNLNLTGHKSRKHSGAKAPESHGESKTTSSDTNLIDDSNTLMDDNEEDSRMDPMVCDNHEGNIHNRSERSASNFCALTPGETTLFQAEEEATLPKYDDPFEDFLEMFIQFAYVSMFACAFPLAGLFCLLNNILEIRSDAFKLISSFQRPFGANVSSIGVWQIALEGLSYVAVAVNMGLLAVSGGLGRILKEVSPTTVIIVVVSIEHIIILIKFLIEQAIPNVPFWIEQERCMIEHKRRQALKTIEIVAMKERRKNRASSCEPMDQRTSSNVNNINPSNTQTDESVPSSSSMAFRTRSRTSLSHGN